jgi:hypothetical protein
MMPDIEKSITHPPLGTANEEECYGGSGLPLVVGVTLTSGNANVKGAWVELKSSTTNKVVAIVVCFMNSSASSNFLIDIGVGGAGSEAVIIPDIFYHQGSASYKADGSAYGPLMIHIPAGSRIAARCQANGASKTVSIGLTLIETE